MVVVVCVMVFAGVMFFDEVMLFAGEMSLAGVMAFAGVMFSIAMKEVTRFFLLFHMQWIIRSECASPSCLIWAG